VSAPNEQPDIDAVLADLQREFLVMLPQRVQELRAALALAETDLAARVTVARIGHRLSGTAATVGLRGVGEAGRAIERFARSRPMTWSREDLDTLSRAVDALDRWMTHHATSPYDHDASLLEDPRVRALDMPPATSVGGPP
jgi:HPt (histidine-containing phosphotransfer) domain-containing protein